MSSFDQNPERQLENVTVEKQFIDRASGINTQRPQLEAMQSFVCSLIRERQLEGIALAKDHSAYRGRKRALSTETIAKLHKLTKEGECKTKLSREFGISCETLYQYLRTVSCICQGAAFLLNTERENLLAIATTQEDLVRYYTLSEAGFIRITTIPRVIS